MTDFNDFEGAFTIGVITVASSVVFVVAVDFDFDTPSFFVVDFDFDDFDDAIPFDTDDAAPSFVDVDFDFGGLDGMVTIVQLDGGTRPAI